MTNLRSFSLPHPNKFQIGDIAKAKRLIRFMDKTKHDIGQEIVVTEETKSYFNVCHSGYERIAKQ